MKKSLKIISLVVAILLAVGGVMKYYKTIVSPPGKMNFENQHVNSDKNDISKVTSAKTDFALDSIFVAITHELDLQLANSFLTDQERNELLELFATQYVPAFVSACNSKFSKSVWNEGELQKINTRISELQALTTTDKKVVIRGEVNTSLDEVHKVIINYNEAKKATYVGGYNGLDAARRKIAEAQKYASISPIINCSDLVARLNSVPERLEKKHYQYLVGKVKRLQSSGSYYSEIEYDNVKQELDEYKRYAKEVYGRISDTRDLDSFFWIEPTE